MKIAINCIFLQPKAGGIREYIINLVKNITEIDKQSTYLIYVLKDQIEYAKKHLPQDVVIKSVPYKSGGGVNTILRSLFGASYWRREEEVERFDIFHSPFFHSPKFRAAKVVLTVHDLRFYRFPKSYKFSRRLYLQYAVPRSIKGCDHIISISNFTKQELIEAYKVKADKITAIHEAIDFQKFSRREQPNCFNNREFILSVSHIEPRKNYKRLVESFNLLRKDERYRDIALVIVGQKAHQYKEVIELFERTEGVHYLNFIEFDHLLWLYQNAKLFIFPSYYEGFGFTPLEAGSMGCVAAVSNVSVMPEVCADGVFYFDPFDIEDMAQVMAQAISNEELRAEKISKMTENLKRFSWRKNGEQTIEVYRQLYRCKDE